MEERRGNGIHDKYQLKARVIVFDYLTKTMEVTDKHVTFGLDEVYVVWFSKTLNNWKALVSSTLPNQMYFEVTYDGDKCQTYLDAYKKWENVCIKDEEFDPDFRAPSRENVLDMITDEDEGLMGERISFRGEIVSGT